MVNILLHEKVVKKPTESDLMLLVEKYTESMQNELCEWN